MGSGWSVFVVRGGASVRLVDACRTTPGGTDGTMIVGPPLDGFVPFVFEVDLELFDDGDGRFAQALSGTLADDVWMVYGDSSTDSMDLLHCRRGLVVGEAPDPIDDGAAPFDLDDLRAWAEFGVSGLVPTGQRTELTARDGG